MSEKQKLIVVMGVSGCGKSSVAQALATHFKIEFVEADDFHPLENREHMANGLALNDTMREPWIALLQAHLKQSARSGRSCVMSFSGLRRLHRAKIRDLPFDSLFIHLEGDRQLIAKRMNARVDHFMTASLLESQYQTLESANKKETIISIDIDQSLELVIADSIAAAKKQMTM
ncbi:MAG: AAA family ATPase [Arenicella sp.]|nr:AAA family ATPase [Arenicella sp.]